MDKLTESISFKVSPRIKIMIEDKALEEGIEVSELIRRYVLQAIHLSNFHIKDYLKTTDESQED
jgi:hypothetical protein